MASADCHHALAPSSLTNVLLRKHHCVQDCGHSMYDAGIKHQLLEATDCMRALHDGSQCHEDNLHTAVY